MLARLAALNAERRTEEAAGHVRWLRPSFQAPGASAVQSSLDVASMPRTSVAARRSAAAFPETLAGQMNAVRSVVEASVGGVSATDVAGTFAGLRPAVAAELLTALAALGLVRNVEGRYV